MNAASVIAAVAPAGATGPAGPSGSTPGEAGLPALFAALLDALLPGRPQPAPGAGSPAGIADPDTAALPPGLAHLAAADPDRQPPGLAAWLASLGAPSSETPAATDGPADLAAALDALDAALADIDPDTAEAAGLPLDELHSLLEALKAALAAPPAAAIPDTAGLEMAPAPAGAADPRARLAALAARLETIATRLEGASPKLAGALTSFAAALREAGAPQPDAPRPLAAQANATPPAADRPAPQPPANSAAPATPQPSADAARAQAAPPPPPQRTADTDAIRPTGLERLPGDPRADVLLTARPVTAAGAPQAAGLDLDTLAVEIAHRFHAGIDRFQIRLDPPDLGRIDVRLHIEGDRVSARLTVDRAETLELLQRDARALERALGQAGLGNDRPALEFALRQNPFSRDGDAHRPQPDAAAPQTAAADEAAPSLSTAWRALTRPGGIDRYA